MVIVGIKDDRIGVWVDGRVLVLDVKGDSLKRDNGASQYVLAFGAKPGDAVENNQRFAVDEADGDPHIYISSRMFEKRGDVDASLTPYFDIDKDGYVIVRVMASPEKASCLWRLVPMGGGGEKKPSECLRVKRSGILFC
jgi:hypothetical protein